MPKYDVGEIITAFNEAVSKLNNLRTKYDDLEKENARLREALREIRNKARTGRPPFMSSKTDFFQIASKALGEKE
jgi:predicted  nucleic acid-binding Zn-ribbon protein